MRAIVPGVIATIFSQETIDAAIGRENYHLKERGGAIMVGGAIVNVTPENQRKILDALNKEYNFGLSFINRSDAAQITRKVRPIMETRGLPSFLSVDREDFFMTTVNSCFTLAYRNVDHDPDGGLVFIR